MPSTSAQDLATKFDGWVMISQYEEGVLLQTDIEAIDPRAEGGECEGHTASVRADYALTSSEEATLLCGAHVQAIVDNQPIAGGYVIGALPAN